MLWCQKAGGYSLCWSVVDRPAQRVRSSFPASQHCLASFCRQTNIKISWDLGTLFWSSQPKTKISYKGQIPTERRPIRESITLQSMSHRPSNYQSHAPITTFPLFLLPTSPLLSWFHFCQRCHFCNHGRSSNTEQRLSLWFLLTLSSIKLDLFILLYSTSPCWQCRMLWRKRTLPLHYIS